MVDFTTIKISFELKKKLDQIGKKGQTYEELIKILLDNYKKK